MRNHPIYASTAGVARNYSNLSDLLSDLCSNGLDRIELGWSPPLAGLSLPRDLAAFTASWLIHNYFPAPSDPFVLNLSSQDANTLRRSREFGLAAIRLSAQLGAPFYSIHCGFLAEFDPQTLGRKLSFDDICPYDRGYATFVESLQLLLSEARSVGTRLLIEPNVVAPFNLIDGQNLLLMFAEAHEFAQLMKDLGSSNLGLLLDLGHLKVSATTLGFKIEDFIAASAPYIHAFHLHDNDGSADQHLPVAAGSWALDVLRQSRFDGLPVVVEAKFNTALAMAKHCFWLKTLLNS